MLNVEVGAGAPAGYVRAVFSSRWKGCAAPLDLMRAHLRAVSRSAWRRRVAESFAGYLVTDADDLALRELEGRGVLAFSERRQDYRPEFDRLAATGRGPWYFDLQEMADSGHGCMDAPGYLAAGAMYSFRCNQSGDVVRAPALWRRPE